MHRPRWRGSPCERHALRVLPGIVVLAVFIIGVVIGNGAIARIRIAYSADTELYNMHRYRYTIHSLFTLGCKPPSEALNHRWRRRHLRLGPALLLPAGWRPLHRNSLVPSPRCRQAARRCATRCARRSQRHSQHAHADVSGAADVDGLHRSDHRVSHLHAPAAGCADAWA